MGQQLCLIERKKKREKGEKNKETTTYPKFSPFFSSNGKHERIHQKNKSYEIIILYFVRKTNSQGKKLRIGFFSLYKFITFTFLKLNSPSFKNSKRSNYRS